MMLYNQKNILKFNLLILFLLYIIIFAGGVVRSTGSGMGCPDWPKCFDNWIPPLNKNQLSKNYKKIFYKKRIEKNNRVFSFFKRIKLFKSLKNINNEYNIRSESNFNLLKTWIEYVNRLIGVALGIVVLFNFIILFLYYKKINKIVFLSGIVLILTIIQGFIGSLVVSTHLLPFLVTLHMLISLIIMMLLVLIISLIKSLKLVFYKSLYIRKIYITLSIILSFSIFQILLGTQLRESVSLISNILLNTSRDSWLQYSGIKFKIHRTFSLFYLLLHFYLLYLFYKYKNKFFFKISSALLFFVLLIIFIGFFLSYFNMPVLIQPLHLLFSTIIFSIQLYLIFILKFSKKIKNL